ncbi:MAG: tetratricopeptide repeat protein [bacterium]
MRIKRSRILSKKVHTLLFLVAIMGGCGDFKEAAFERGIDLYLSGEYEDATKILEASTKLMADDPDVYAWYAECMIATGQYEKAEKAAHTALRINPEHGFSHTVLGRLFDPMSSSWEKADGESAWFYLCEAIKFDPGDGNAWMALIPYAQRRNDAEVEIRADTMLIVTGFLTNAILNYSRWVLKHLPPNAILITGGDLDTYSCLALQAREGIRNDVGIIDLRLLGWDWYVNRIAEGYSLIAFSSQIQTSDSEDEMSGSAGSNWRIVSGIISMIDAGFLKRPLCLSRLIGDTIPSEISQKLISKGAYYQLRDDKQLSNQDVMEKAIPIAEIELFAGSFVSDSDRSPKRHAEAERLRKDIGLP